MIREYLGESINLENKLHNHFKLFKVFKKFNLTRSLLKNDDEYELNTPDWITTELNKSPIKNPLLEILKQISHKPQLMKDYLFPYLLGLDQFEWSKEVQKKVDSLLNENLTYIDFILRTYLEVKSFEKLVKYVPWQQFESITAAVLTYHNYEYKLNFRYKQSVNRKRMVEVDILAWNKSKKMVLLIDCKRYKTPSQAPIRKAVEKQVERTYQLFEMIPEIHDLASLVWVNWNSVKIIPMIVTWKDHQIRSHQTEELKNVSICPIGSFNRFLLDFSIDSQADFYLKYSSFDLN